MKNFVSNGATMNATTPAGGIVSGDLLIVGQVAGVAVHSAPEGEIVVLNTEKVYELPKAAAAISQGVKVYWNAADKTVVTTASGNTYIGSSWDAADAAAPVVPVKLNA